MAEAPLPPSADSVWTAEKSSAKQVGGNPAYDRAQQNVLCRATLL